MMPRILISLILSLNVHLLQAQSADSLAQMMLAKADSLHAVDSLNRIILLAEIEQLKKEKDASKETELQEKLREIQAQDSIKQQRLKEKVESLRTYTTGQAVAPFGDTLFLVYCKLGPFSPQERAQQSSQKIKTLAKSKFFRDSLKVVTGEQHVELHYQSTILLSISEEDALWVQTSQELLMARYQELIIKAVEEERELSSVRGILIRIGLVLLIIVGLVVLTRMINKLFRWLKHKIILKKEVLAQGISIRNYPLLDSARQLRVYFILLTGLRYLVIFITFYISLPLLFSLFPWTKGIADTLLELILSPVRKIVLGIFHYVPNLLTIAVVYIFTKYTVKFLRFITDEIERGALTVTGFYPDLAKPTFNIVRVLLYAFMLVMIWPYLPGSDSEVFKGVSVFLGVLLSLGSSSAISNMVAGLVITYMRPFKVGDRVKIGEIVGDVVEKSMLVTRIRTIKNEDITVPNASVLSGHTVNYSTAAEGEGLIMHTTVTIGYDVPWQVVHELLISAAKKTEGILETPPFVLQTSLDDFYVSYQLNAYTRQANKMAAIYSELHRNIQDSFNEAGVEIMSPHYRAMRDGDMTTIPVIYLPDDYKAPGFNKDKKKGQ
ncbi:mechanosensitive ion channel [Cytophagales bacterium LB-30]|uniref:Mechanosensitive ion channel n=1 Tax=Shiella aurantiaca TaxID=3058365 RepID=A0ABT8F5M9_9BACT|nr:mechanosensitive ion channel domain-containing protein [Shiella aurantiaca]MDN4165695.1 mechanosensitive ion channel [Shiella aurantiaca]